MKETTKYVYLFGGTAADGAGEMKELLGGKGANLAEMVNLGIPVPPGFTIATPMCTRFYEEGERFPDALRPQVAAGIAHIEAVTGKRFGDPADPLLVSVRSGARVSMPGMMDTVLNLGLNDKTVEGLTAASGDPRFAWDSYRRFIQMYGSVVLGIDHHRFEEIIEHVKLDRGAIEDTELSAQDWHRVVDGYKEMVREVKGRPFPQDPQDQLWGAIGAVFGSWMNPRANTYRRLHDIPADWGTAVNVQAMVFGNMGEDCATGVCFTRDPSTGEDVFYGEFLINAQGEDVVVRPFERRAVIEHQQHARHRLDEEQEERDAAHAPGERERDALLLDRDGMQVQEEIREHDHDPIPPIERHRMTEDALPDLGVADRFADGHESSLPEPVC